MRDLELDGHSVSFDRTNPTPSRWDQDGAEYVKDNAEWVARLARRIVELRSEVELVQARDLAQELSLDDALRARSPEIVADEMTADSRTLGLFD